MKNYNTLDKKSIDKKIKKFDKTYRVYHNKMLKYYDKNLAGLINKYEALKK